MLKHPETLRSVQAKLRDSPEADDDILLQACIRETSGLYAGMNTLRLARQPTYPRARSFLYPCILRTTTHVISLTRSPRFPTVGYLRVVR